MLSEKPWKLITLVRVLMGTLICVSSVLLLESLLLHGSGKKDPDSGSFPWLLFGTLGVHGSILAAIGFALRSEGVRWTEAFGFAHQPGRAMGLGALIGVGFLPVGMLMQAASETVYGWLQREVPVEQAVDTLQKASPGMARTYLLFFAVLLAPVAEEMFFRGVVYPAIKQAGFPRLAWWGTSVLFAGIHLNLPILLPLVALSLALIWLYEKTDNLLAPIAAHGAFNFCEAMILLVTQSHEKHPL